MSAEGLEGLQAKGGTDTALLTSAVASLRLESQEDLTAKNDEPEGIQRDLFIEHKKRDILLKREKVKRFIQQLSSKVPQHKIPDVDTITMDQLRELNRSIRKETEMLKARLQEATQIRAQSPARFVAANPPPQERTPGHHRSASQSSHPDGLASQLTQRRKTDPLLREVAQASPVLMESHRRPTVHSQTSVLSSGSSGSPGSQRWAEIPPCSTPSHPAPQQPLRQPFSGGHIQFLEPQQPVAFPPRQPASVYSVVGPVSSAYSPQRQEMRLVTSGCSPQRQEMRLVTSGCSPQRQEVRHVGMDPGMVATGFQPPGQVAMASHIFPQQRAATLSTRPTLEMHGMPIRPCSPVYSAQERQFPPHPSRMAGCLPPHSTPGSRLIAVRGDTPGRTSPGMVQEMFPNDELPTGRQAIAMLNSDPILFCPSPASETVTRLPAATEAAVVDVLENGS